MIITKISQQLKNSNRANIFIDGKFVFSLSLDQLLDTKLKIGTEIDNQKYQELSKLSAIGKLKMRTLEWLMLRPRSAKELKDYLIKKKCSSEESAQLVTYFQNHNYQNDVNFSRWWTEQRRAKHKSAAFIRFELKNKGIDEETIKSALGEKQSDLETLRNLVIKKRQINKYQDDKKLIEFLLRQGYRYSLIKEVLAE